MQKYGSHLVTSELYFIYFESTNIAMSSLANCSRCAWTAESII